MAGDGKLLMLAVEAAFDAAGALIAAATSAVGETPRALSRTLLSALRNAVAVWKRWDGSLAIAIRII
jgi:hypothetical protein